MVLDHPALVQRLGVPATVAPAQCLALLARVPEDCAAGRVPFDAAAEAVYLLAAQLATAGQALPGKGVGWWGFEM